MRILISYEEYPIINIPRLFVGVLFIISGLIKANDTIGFSYKLGEYFEVFGMEWLTSFALIFAVSISIFEILLGVMLLIGSQSRNKSNWIRIPLVIIISGFISGNRKRIISSFWNIYGWCVFGIGEK